MVRVAIECAEVSVTGDREDNQDRAAVECGEAERFLCDRADRLFPLDDRLGAVPACVDEALADSTLSSRTCGYERILREIDIVGRDDRSSQRQ